MLISEKIHLLCDRICELTDNREIEALANQIDWYIVKLKDLGDIAYLETKTIGESIEAEVYQL